MTDEQARVLSCERMTGDLYRLVLHAPQIAQAAKPGQFVHLLVPDGAHVLRRPVSLMAYSPQAGTLTLAVQVKGRGTQILCAAKPGDAIKTLGPLGRGFDAGEARRVYFVGGGVGVAPVCCAMDAFAGEGSRAFFGFRSASCAYGMTQAPCPVTAVTDDGTLGERALVTKPLEEAVAAQKPQMIMACGPLPMLRAVRRVALAWGVPCQLSLEERMGCGIGACLGCSVKRRGADGSWGYARVCRDGPVFDAGEVLFDD